MPPIINDDQTPGVMDREGLLALIRSWAEDKSGYDDRAWPILQKAIEETAYPRGNALMTRPLVLDAGPVGRIIHPARNREIDSWLRKVMEAGFTVILPEIADYEVRRNLILEGLTESLRRLDGLRNFLVYQRITPQIMMRPAELWADARRQGRPTADEKALDGDVILAATAQMHDGIVITDNVGHLGRFVEAHRWSDFKPPEGRLPS